MSLSSWRVPMGAERGRACAPPLSEPRLACMPLYCTARSHSPLILTACCAPTLLPPPETGLALSQHGLMDSLWRSPNNGTLYAVLLPLAGGEPGFVWHQVRRTVSVRGTVTWNFLPSRSTAQVRSCLRTLVDPHNVACARRRSAMSPIEGPFPTCSHPASRFVVHHTPATTLPIDPCRWRGWRCGAATAPPSTRWLAPSSP